MQKKKIKNCKCKFHTYQDKVKVLENAKKLKGTGISTNGYFRRKPQDLIWNRVKQLQSQGKVAYLNYCTVVCREREIIININFVLIKQSFCRDKKQFQNLIFNLSCLVPFLRSIPNIVDLDANLFQNFLSFDSKYQKHEKKL